MAKRLPILLGDRDDWPRYRIMRIHVNEWMLLSHFSSALDHA